MLFRALIFVSLPLVFLSESAVAHHSGAMFDADKQVTIEGVVKQMQLTNPHSWLQVVATDASGNSVEWSFEMAAPTVLIRGGFTKNSLKPGDKVTVVGNPLRDGRPGAGLVSVKTASGEVLPRRAP
jgi:hypothetical protein